MRSPCQRPTRILPTLVLPALGLVVLHASCSSGLNTPEPCSVSPVGSTSGNVTTGLFLGFPLTSPGGARASIDNQALAAARIPGVSATADLDIAFYAFATDAAADDAGAPGARRFLDRDGISDSNGVGDIFVAAVVAEQVDEAAFSYSLAGKFRHARCVNCHSVAKEPGFAGAPLSTVFHASTHPTVEGVEAPQPGSGRFQNTNENSCLTCHQAILDQTGGTGSPLNRGWRNPKLSADADFRLLSNAALANRARSAPDRHFETDRRVTWALDSGALPSRSVINGPFEAADDDHDGIVEPFDGDGRRRTVPGGRAMFVGEVNAFLCGAPNDTRDAIADIALVSRTFDSPAQAPNAASSQPDIVFIAEPAFNPATGGLAGRLLIVYVSDATDIDVLATSGNLQVFRATIRVMVAANRSVNLAYIGTELVSTNVTATAEGNADSTAPRINSRPSVQGANDAGERVAFASAATNLGPTGGLGVIYVRDLETGQTVRASGSLQGCSDPAIDPTGNVVAFVTSQAGTSLGVSDTNGVDDVYYSRLDSTGVLAVEADFPQRASRTNGVVGESDPLPSSEPAVMLDGDERILVAFTSQSELDAIGIPSGGSGVASNVFVHQFTGVPNNVPLRVTSQVSLGLGLTGQLRLPDGASRRPTFPGRSDRLVFETDSTNLDASFLLPPDPEFGIFTFKSGDENSAPDLAVAFLGGLLEGNGFVRVKALSVSPAGAYGDGETVLPVAAGVVSAIPTGHTVVGGLTFARNLGAEDNHSGLNPAERTTWLSFVQDSAPDPVTEFQRVCTILRARCMPCHATGGLNAALFGLGDNDGELYTELTTGLRTCSIGDVRPYVLPGAASNSLIIQVMEGPTCGLSQMPSFLAPVPVSLIDVVRDWINSGASQTE